MFQDILVKISKITAKFTPICEGKIAIMPSMTIGKKPKMGIDWRTSSNGISIDSAFRFLAATIPTARLNMMLIANAISILIQESIRSITIVSKLKGVVFVSPSSAAMWPS